MKTGLRTPFTFPDFVSVIALVVALGERLTGLRNRFTFPNLVSLIALFVALGGPSYAASQAGGQQTVDNSIRDQDLRAGQVTSAGALTRSIASADLPVLFNVNYCDGPALVTRAHTAYPGSATATAYLHNLRASSSVPAC